ncbi:MAG: zinc-binding dehydrogenase [Candidatus Kapabacteria bacterium]|nr:zinc-binding dehydrogenase [Candidatus Kapabacteria bacterium]
MKAVILNQHGGPEVLEYVEDFPMPELKPGEVLVKIKSTSLNKVDTVIRKGYPGLTLGFPHILGGDIAGEVVDISQGIGDDLIGSRVVVYPLILPNERNPKYNGREHLNKGWKYFGMHLNGSYAEYVAVPTNSLIKLPDDISYESAAALPVAGLTAYNAVVRVGRLNERDTFFIWGGSGGMGTIAIQVAKASGATVIATCGKNDKKQTLLDLGADYVFNHHEDDVLAEVKKLFPDGIDLVLDYVGPVTFDKSFAMVATGGKILLCGMITGREVNLNIQQTYFRQISINGLFLGAQHDFSNLLQLVAADEVKPVIARTFDLKDMAEAHKLLESGDFVGKIMINI